MYLNNARQSLGLPQNYKGVSPPYNPEKRKKQKTENIKDKRLTEEEKNGQSTT